MTARTPSRTQSLLSVDSRSRRSSIQSNPDIFSDDYALDPIDPELLNLALSETHDSDDTVINDHPNTITPYPAIPQRLSVHGRPSSTAKRPIPNDGSSSVRGAMSERTLSTSSRFTIPRSTSPYNGPTAPSHPYAMYPQITRTSSTASMSTIRPQERPFVSTGGPEHPYSMYQQNTVADDGEDIGTQPLMPLGFSRSGPGGSSRSDVGDIVGSDGHIEQLPPYTRYADNIIAKGDMNEIHGPQASETDTPSSERTGLISSATTMARSIPESDETEPLTEEVARKEGWREKAKKRVCGGSIALWLLLMIIGLMLIAGLLGGVIGGVVGRKQGSTAASASATRTIFIDADPAATDASTPTCPTGKYTIPFNQTSEIHGCVPSSMNSVAWGCLDFAYLGMTIGKGADNQPTVTFDDYSNTPQQFLYGPQPPDFNGSTITMAPYISKDEKDLGVAMFFYQEFDKLVILPSNAISTSKRSVDADDLLNRGANWENNYLQIGDQPWYCFWNSSINEFWIFLEEPVASRQPNTTSGILSSVTSAPMFASTASSASTGTGGVVAHQVSQGTTWGPAFTNFNPTRTFGVPFPSDTNNFGPKAKEKRTYTQAYYPTYPKLIKMIEKRKDVHNVQPYCQKMQVLNSWQIVPLEENVIVFINEIEFASQPVSMGNKFKRDSTNDVKSNCLCEWMSS